MCASGWAGVDAFVRAGAGAGAGARANASLGFEIWVTDRLLAQAKVEGVGIRVYRLA